MDARRASIDKNVTVKLPVYLFSLCN